jgi:hypothetical protein
VVLVGVTGKLLPDGLVPMDVPPVGTKNQLIVPPPAVGPVKLVMVTVADPTILSTVYI